MEPIPGHVEILMSASYIITKGMDMAVLPMLMVINTSVNGKTEISMETALFSWLMDKNTSVNGKTEISMETALISIKLEEDAPKYGKTERSNDMKFKSFLTEMTTIEMFHDEQRELSTSNI